LIKLGALGLFAPKAKVAFELIAIHFLDKDRGIERASLGFLIRHYPALRSERKRSQQPLRANKRGRAGQRVDMTGQARSWLCDETLKQVDQVHRLRFGRLNKMLGGPNLSGFLGGSF